MQKKAINIDDSAKVHGNRLVNKDGSSNLFRKGINPFASYNFHHSLVSMSWKNFLLLCVLFYVVAIGLFAGIYFLYCTFVMPDKFDHTGWSLYYEMFVISLQTFSAVEYEVVGKLGKFGHLVGLLEVIVRDLSLAVLIGILFARFAKPSANLIYSQNGLISKDGKTLTFRIINAKLSQLIDAEAQLIISFVQSNTNKTTSHYVELENNKIPFMTSNWSVVHNITEHSPLFGLSKDDLIKRSFEFILLIKAIDDNYSHEVHSRTSYLAESIVWNAKFKPNILNYDNLGRVYTDIKDVGEYIEDYGK